MSIARSMMLSHGLVMGNILHWEILRYWLGSGGRGEYSEVLVATGWPPPMLKERDLLLGLGDGAGVDEAPIFELIPEVVALPHQLAADLPGNRCLVARTHGRDYAALRGR